MVGVIACAGVRVGIVDFFVWIARDAALTLIIDLHVSFVARICADGYCIKCTNGTGVLDDGACVFSAQIDQFAVLTLGFVCSFDVADDRTMRNVAVFTTIAIGSALIEGRIAIDFFVVVIGAIQTWTQRAIGLF